MLVMVLNVELDNTLMIPFQPALKEHSKSKNKGERERRFPLVKSHQKKINKNKSHAEKLGIMVEENPGHTWAIQSVAVEK